MLKRLMVFLVIAAMLAGCASGAKPDPAPSSDTSAPKQQDPVTLDFPSWQAEEPGFAEYWKALIDEYQKTHPGVTVKLTQIPFKSYVETLTTRFAGNNPPDIVHLPSRNFPQFADQGWLAPLDDLLKSTDIPANWTPLQTEMVWEGKTQGVLLMGYGFVLYYNEKMLQDAGLSVPRTPEELVHAAKTLTKGDVFGFGTTTTEHPNIYSDVSLYVAGMGHSWVKDNKYNFTAPAFVKAVDIWRELTRYSPKGVTSEQKRQLFFDGKVAMMMDGPFVLAGRDKAVDAVKPHAKIAPVPFPTVPGSVSNSLHIPASLSAEKKQLVWDFIQLAASPKFQALYMEKTKSPAPRKNVLSQDAVAKDPEMSLIAESAAKAISFTPESKNIKANYNEFSKIISTAMMKLMTTDAPTADVLADLEKELTAKVKP